MAKKGEPRKRRERYDVSGNVEAESFIRSVREMPER
jgi:hypothetical protein